MQWVLSAYLISFGGLLLLGGRSADQLGRRRMFMIGTALFLIASLLCGLAWSAEVLVAARVVQGLSAAIMAPTALSILMTTFEEGAERNKALGVWSGIGGIGATAALLVGGPITDGLGWEWVFFLNVPVAFVLLALSRVLLRESRARTDRPTFDLAGATTITAAVVLLIYAVVEAPNAGWTGVQTIGLLAASAILIGIFVVVEKRSADPLVPLQIFRSGTVMGGNLVMLVVGMLGFGMSYVISLFAQQVLGYSALAFGLGTVVMTAGTVVGSALGQAVVSKSGFRPVAVAGLSLMGIGCLALSQLAVDSTYFGGIFFGLLIFGPGLGAGFVVASIAALAGVPEKQSGLASGINTAAFQIGGAAGVAIVSSVSVFYKAGPDSLTALAEGFQAGFVACVVIAIAGVLVSLVLLRRPRGDRDEGHDKNLAAAGAQVGD